MRALYFFAVLPGLVGQPIRADEIPSIDNGRSTQLQRRLRKLERELAVLKSEYEREPGSADVDWVDSESSAFRTAIQQTGLESSASVEELFAPTGHPIFPTISASGFIHMDWQASHQDTANRAAVGDIQDGVHFTRARVSLQGDAWQDVSYILEMDFGLPERPTFVDLFLDYDTHSTLGHFRVGRWRQPFGMDALTSIRELTFLERATLFAFGPFRQTGIGFYDTTGDEQSTWAVSGFRYPSDGFGTNLGDNGGYGLAARVTRVLIDDTDGGEMFHVGGSYSYSDPSADTVRYRATPELFNSGFAGALTPGVPNNIPFFVDTGPINTAYQNQVGVELAGSYGRLYVQSEWMYTFLEQAGGPALGFPGMYVHSGFFLTGEHRQYNHKNAVFGRVRPNCNFGADGGPGAWEIAARWSYIDLNDQNIAGGRLNDVTLGLNWYWNPRTKFQFNYIYSALNDATQGDSRADLFALRAQVDF